MFLLHRKFYAWKFSFSCSYICLISNVVVSSITYNTGKKICFELAQRWATLPPSVSSFIVLVVTSPGERGKWIGESSNEVFFLHWFIFYSHFFSRLTAAPFICQLNRREGPTMAEAGSCIVLYTIVLPAVVQMSTKHSVLDGNIS